MRTMEIKVYNFKELPEEIQDKVLEKYQDINTNYDWYDYIISDWTYKLNKIGFLVEKKDIEFSGFYSQGDGASFRGQAESNLINRIIKVIPKYKLLRVYADDNKLDINCNIINLNNHYSHARTKRLELNHTLYEEDNIDLILKKKIEELLTDLEGYLEDLRMDLCGVIYKQLEQEYDYLNSKAAVIETLEANEYEFNEKGEIV